MSHQFRNFDIVTHKIYVNNIIGPAVRSVT